MIGYCQWCGCAVYTADDVGDNYIVWERVCCGVTPRLKYVEIPTRHLVCRSCVEDDQRDLEKYLVSEEFKH